MTGNGYVSNSRPWWAPDQPEHTIPLPRGHSLNRVIFDEIHNLHHPTEENPMVQIRNNRAPLTRADYRLIGHHVTVYRMGIVNAEPLADGIVENVDVDEGMLHIRTRDGGYVARLSVNDVYLDKRATDPTQDPTQELLPALEYATLETDQSDVGLRLAAMNAAAAMDGTNPVDVAKQFYEFLTETPTSTNDAPDVVVVPFDQETDMGALYDWIDARLIRDNPGTEDDRRPRIDRVAPVYRTRRFHLSFRIQDGLSPESHPAGMTFVTVDDVKFIDRVLPYPDYSDPQTFADAAELIRKILAGRRLTPTQANELIAVIGSRTP